MTKHITANSVSEAWAKVNEIFPTDYEYDNGSRERAGYEIYRSTVTDHNYDYICDLGDRLEINLSNGDTVNVWIETAEEMPVDNTEVSETTETAPDTSRFEIELTATATGEMQTFKTYDHFISAWRFWFNSGEVCKCDEQTFFDIMRGLQSVNIDGSRFEFIRNGLQVAFIYCRW